jgi:NTP pyrophosphatase (non-canonical NTP hydrolase)
MQYSPTAEVINELSRIVRKANAQWWTDLETGLPIQRNVGELLMLTVSELAEAMEGHRKNLPDDKLPRRSMLEVELADAMIRILDIAGGLGLDLAEREDHKREARLRANGKKY